jgi:hypothetical protein
MPRRTPITLKGQIAALVAKGDVGRRSLILDDSDIRLLLRAAIEQEGNISAFAKRHGLERSQLTNVLNGKRPVSGPLVEAMGLRKVYVPQHDGG